MFHITISGHWLLHSKKIKRYWLYIVLSLEIKKSKVNLSNTIITSEIYC